MPPITNLYIDQGVDYKYTINTNISLTNYQVFGQIRKFYGVSTYYNFNCEITDVDTGVIDINLLSSVSSTMSPGRYVYDVLLIDPTGTRVRILEGSLELIPQVTEVETTPPEVPL